MRDQLAAESFHVCSTELCMSGVLKTDTKISRGYIKISLEENNKTIRLVSNLAKISCSQKVRNNQRKLSCYCRKADPEQEAFRKETDSFSNPKFLESLGNPEESMK